MFNLIFNLILQDVKNYKMYKMSPVCVCVCVREVLARNTPQIFLYSSCQFLRVCGFCAWPFKCKWAAAEGGVSRVLAAPTQTH